MDSREARRGESLLSFNCLGRLFVLIDDRLQPIFSEFFHSPNWGNSRTFPRGPPVPHVGDVMLPYLGLEK